VTWWKPAEQAVPPTPGVSELHRLIIEAQSDITLLYEQLERINNRLKQRASRASHSTGDDRSDLAAADNRPEFVAPLPPEKQHFDGFGPFTEGTNNGAGTSSLTKAEVQKLWRERHPSR